MKKSLVIALALMLVLAFASSAMAAQSTLQGEYISTTTGVYYSEDPTTKTFTADSITNYPYEIYLPNEKDPASYRIHSNYAKNTDACASCHSTHTAVGNTLLQWYSVYETCMACHDGTVTTTYDVLNGKIGVGKAAMGGAFGTTDGSASNHNVTGALSIAAAPGGTTAEDETVTLQNGTQTRWIPTFGCESCHTPHGAGGNARILHPDPNFAASNAVDPAGYAVVATAIAGNPTLIKGYPYDVQFWAGAANVTATAAVYLDNRLGYSVIGGADAATITKVYGTKALTVKMIITNYLNGSYEAGETVQHVSGMNAFCGACHTDYNTDGVSHSSDTESGTYSNAHRHQVGVAPSYNTASKLADAGMVLEGNNADPNLNELECLTCHVAHGVNADYWNRTVGFGQGGLGYLEDQERVELAGSSALKRLPNMGTCEACHQKGALNEGYSVNTGITATVYADLLEFANPLSYELGQAVSAGGLDPKFVGSAVCAKCHVQIEEEWGTSGHSDGGTSGGHAFGGVYRYTNADGSNNNGQVTVLSQNRSCAGEFGVNQPDGYYGCHENGYWGVSAGGTIATVPASFRRANNTLGGVVGTGEDTGLTCEGCHGSGANHIKAPSSKNINGPAVWGNTTNKSQVCAKCHDIFTFGTGKAADGSAAPMFKSNGIETTVAGTAYTTVGFATGAGGRNFNDPGTLKNGDVTGLSSGRIGSSHGGITKFADSQHFIQGVLACSSCHNPHDTELKMGYAQLCKSCHGTFGTLDQTMGATTAHSQYDHSFGFGFTGQTIADSVYVGLPTADMSKANKTVASIISGGKNITVTGTAYLLNAAGTQTPANVIRTNNAGTYVVDAPATAVEGRDYSFDATTGVITLLYATITTDAKGFYGISSYINASNPNVTLSAKNGVNYVRLYEVK